MSKIQKHKIHTASLKVDFEGVEEGLGVQDSLGLFFYEKIKPALEKVFDKYGDPKATIVFDKLELDCGQVSYENWEENIVKQVIYQLEENLESLPKERKKFISEEKKAEEVFFHFLQKGYFPWNSPFINLKDLEESILLGIPLLEKLKSIFVRNPATKRRFFNSFSTAFISKLIGLISQKSDIKYLALVKYLQTQNNPLIQRDLFHALIISYQGNHSFSNSYFLENLISNFSSENLTHLADYIAKEVRKESDIWEELKSMAYGSTTLESREKVSLLMQIILKKDPSFLKKKGVSLDEINFLSALFAKGYIVDDQLKQNEKKIIIKSDAENRIENTKIRKLTASNQSESTKQEDQDIEEEIFIENAGLVLLHPFIAGLFSNLQLTENGKFGAESDQSLAARVLQFLVYGENEHSENYYPLNKILCGMGITQVLGEKMEISHEIKMECEDLLQAVIGHWSVLKNTSIEGLRETFLQRSGKISRVDKGWKLQVERKTVDVLLAKLPWGLGIIKLTWMAEMMYVEWD
jgi:hypothetical protein